MVRSIVQNYNLGTGDRTRPGALNRVRDAGNYSSRNTSKGALIKEAVKLFSTARQLELSTDDLREMALRGQMFPSSSYENRQRIWDSLHYRYFAPRLPWIIRGLTSASAAGVNSPEFVSLAYLYFALRDRLTFELVTGMIWERWLARSLTISSTDVVAFLDRSAAQHPVRKWSESTRVKLAQSLLAALRDFGMLRGIYAKQIQRPVVAPETVFHLLCILLAEGCHGRAVIEAPDWRLFLWSEDDAAKALAELAQRRWIRFERGGRTVILELIRTPEVDV